jgi:hypothetical protein
LASSDGILKSHRSSYRMPLMSKACDQKVAAFPRRHRKGGSYRVRGGTLG